jgi:hypothetical protein
LLHKDDDFLENEGSFEITDAASSESKNLEPFHFGGKAISGARKKTSSGR